MHLAGDDMAAVWFCELAVAQQAQDEALDACGIAARAGFPSAQAQFATLISQMPQEDGGLGKAAHWGTLGRPTVFFELDRAEPRGLNQQEVIAALIEQLGARRYSKITLKGHTDQLFSASYSEGLGHRLTSSIQQQLVAAGVPAGRIETVSFGSSDPITKGFGIQPLNRRVEIEVDWED
jgi:outer membrane protein OmpA-like peptidoglycan-associated protein